MIRIEQTQKIVVIHDGLDVQITDGVITIRPIAFIGGGALGGPNWAQQALGNQQAQAYNPKLEAYINQPGQQHHKPAATEERSRPNDLHRT